jgi:hypothetical protein
MATAKEPPLRVDDVVSGNMVFIYAATSSPKFSAETGRIIDESYHLMRYAAVAASEGINAMGLCGEVAERLALRLADGRYFLLGNMRHPFNVAYPIIASTNVQEVEAMVDLRIKALAKLSSSERAALGV